MFSYYIGGIKVSGNNIAELKSVVEELEDVVNNESLEYSKKITDFMFAVNQDYKQQTLHDIEVSRHLFILTLLAELHPPMQDYTVLYEMYSKLTEAHTGITALYDSLSEDVQVKMITGRYILPTKMQSWGDDFEGQFITLPVDIWEVVSDLVDVEMFNRIDYGQTIPLTSFLEFYRYTDDDDEGVEMYVITKKYEDGEQIELFCVQLGEENNLIFTDI